VLQHSFFFFLIKHKLYIASGSEPPSPIDKFWVRKCLAHILPSCFILLDIYMGFKNHEMFYVKMLIREN
jgi:hypothetical protein